MVLFSTLISKLNRKVAPFLLRNGLSARFVLAFGNIKDNPLLDGLFMLPFSQKLLEIEIQDMALEAKQPIVKSKLDVWTETIFDSYILPRLDSTTQEQELEEKERERMEREKKLANPRLYAFERFLRPVLTPNEEWADIERWRFHARFCKWLRTEYLICKYSTDIRRVLSTHSKLNVTPLLQRSKYREMFRDGIIFQNKINSKKHEKDHHSTQSYAPLPTISTLNNAFQMKDWVKVKNTQSDLTDMARITKTMLHGTMKDIGSNVQIPVVDPNTSVKHLELEEILEVAGCHVIQCNAFNALCEEAGIYEFWTEEYVSTLADYLLDRTKEYDGDTVILDIGAGDGTLVHFLDMYMSEKVGGQRQSTAQTFKTNRVQKTLRKPTIIAVDDGSWNIEPKAPVETLDYIEALEKFKPHKSGAKAHQLILITSWMPMFVDWTQSFRDYQVDEYILIGQKDNGNCGNNWLTWGNEDYLEDGNEAFAPYKKDGYYRKDLDDLSRLQFSRFDTKSSSFSATVSFRKKQ